MTRIAPSSAPLSTVGHWLDQAAVKRGLIASFQHVRTDSDWLHFAVQLSNVSDLSDRARILQEIEDEWDAHKPHSKWKLLLIPAAN